MALCSKGECTCFLNVSSYGTGENTTISFKSPQVLSITSLSTYLTPYLDAGETVDDYVILNSDDSPKITGYVSLEQDGVEVTGWNSGANDYWGFNVFDGFFHVQQDYGSISTYELTVPTLLFLYVNVENPSYTDAEGNASPKRVHLTSVEINGAIDECFTFVQQEESTAYGSKNAKILYIPYQNTR